MYPDDFFDNCSASEMQGLNIDDMPNAVEIADSIGFNYEEA